MFCGSCGPTGSERGPGRTARAQPSPPRAVVQSQDGGHHEEGGEWALAGGCSGGGRWAAEGPGGSGGLIPEAGVGPGAERPNLRAVPRRGRPAPGAPSTGVPRPWRVTGRGEPGVGRPPRRALCRVVTSDPHRARGSAAPAPPWAGEGAAAQVGRHLPGGAAAGRRADGVVPRARVPPPRGPGGRAPTLPTPPAPRTSAGRSRLQVRAGPEPGGLAGTQLGARLVPAQL